jgi:hypothetical protein
MDELLAYSLGEQLVITPCSLVAAALLSGIALYERRRGTAAELIGVSHQTVMGRGHWWRVVAGGLSHLEAMHLLVVVTGLWHCRVVEFRHGHVFYVTASGILLVASAALSLGARHMGLYSEARLLRLGFFPGRPSANHLAPPYVTCTVGYSGVVFGLLAVSNIDGDLPMLITVLWLLGFNFLAPQADSMGHSAAVLFAACVISPGFLGDFLPSEVKAGGSPSGGGGWRLYYWPCIFFAAATAVFVATRRVTYAETVQQAGPRAAALMAWPGELGCLFAHLLQYVDPQLFIFPIPQASGRPAAVSVAAAESERGAEGAAEEASGDGDLAAVLEGVAVDCASLLLPVVRLDRDLAAALGLDAAARVGSGGSGGQSRRVDTPSADVESGISAVPIEGVDSTSDDSGRDGGGSGGSGGSEGSEGSDNSDVSRVSTAVFVIDDGTLPPGALPLPHPVWRWLTALVRPVVLGNGGGGVARASPVAAFRRRATLASHWLSQHLNTATPYHSQRSRVGGTGTPPNNSSDGSDGSRGGGGGGGGGGGSNNSTSSSTHRRNMTGNGTLASGWLMPEEHSGASRDRGSRGGAEEHAAEEVALQEALRRSLLVGGSPDLNGNEATKANTTAAAAASSSSSSVSVQQQGVAPAGTTVDLGELAALL